MKYYQQLCLTENNVSGYMCIHASNYHHLYKHSQFSKILYSKKQQTRQNLQCSSRNFHFLSVMHLNPLQKHCKQIIQILIKNQIDIFKSITRIYLKRIRTFIYPHNFWQSLITAGTNYLYTIQKKIFTTFLTLV